MRAAATCDAEWAKGFNVAGLRVGEGSSYGRSIRALAVFDSDGPGPRPPTLFVGGHFATADGVRVNNIAEWDGTRWSSLGAGISAIGFDSSNGYVDAMKVFDVDGDGPIPPALFVGGFFSSAGDVNAYSIARWDGTTWSSVGTPFVGIVRSLAVFDDDGAGPNGPALFVGQGSFYEDDYFETTVAKWNGLEWTTAGNGSTGSFHGGVSALMVFDDDGAGPNPPALYAGGSFDAIGTTIVNNIARWDGVSWTTVGGGVTQESSYVSLLTLAVFDDDGPGPNSPALFAGGSFSKAGTTNAHNIAKWNGAEWAAVGGGIHSYSSDGDFGSVDALIVHDDDGNGPLPPTLVVGGFFSVAGTAFSRSVAKWTGVSWEQLGEGTEGSVNSLESFDPDGNGPALPVLYVAGYFSAAGGRNMLSPIALWVAGAWSPLGDGRNSAGFDREIKTLLSTERIGRSPGSQVLYAGGWFNQAGRVFTSGVAEWDGASWSQIGDGLYSGDEYAFTKDYALVYALAVFDPDGEGSASPALFAGGSSLLPGRSEALAKWDGTSWSRLPGAPQFNVRALTVFDDDGSGPHRPALYVGGEFTTIGAITARRLVKWDGEVWSEVGGGTNGSVYSLAVFDDDGPGPRQPSLYVGGAFSKVGDPQLSISRFARWDGASWSGLGQSVDSNVLTLAVHDDDGMGPHREALYVGGCFAGSGTRTSKGIAKWDGVAWSALGAGLDDPYQQACVTTLTSFDTDSDPGTAPILFAGGEFTRSGSSPLYHIASWDGTAWSSLGSGTNHRVEALAGFDDGPGPLAPALFAGGQFTTAGGLDSDHIARWGCMRVPPVAIPGGPYWFDAASLPIDLDATGSFDPDGSAPGFASISRVEWDLGDDGTVDSTVSHAPVSFATAHGLGVRIGQVVPVRLTVVDVDTLSGTAATTIGYRNTAPDAVPNGPYLCSDDRVRLQGEVDDVDLPLGVGELLRIEWDTKPAATPQDIGDGFASAAVQEIDCLDLARRFGHLETIYLNVVDAAGFVASSATTIEIPLSDLVVTSLVVPTGAVRGETIEVEWNGRNQGDAPTIGTWVDRVYLSPDKYVGDDNLITPVDASFTGPVAVGDDYERAVAIVLPDSPLEQTRRYWVVVCSDATNQVPEGPRETNNCSIAGPIVVEGRFVDLVTSIVSVPSGCVQSGTTLQIGYTVTNVGNDATNPPQWTDLVFIVPSESNPNCQIKWCGKGQGVDCTGSCSDQIFCNIEPLPIGVPNQTYLRGGGDAYPGVASIDVPHNIGGTYDVYVLADRYKGCHPGWALREPNKENNLAKVSFCIEREPQADIIAIATSIRFPANIQANNLFNVTWQDENLPNAAAPTDSGTWLDTVCLTQTIDGPCNPSTDVILGSAGPNGPILDPGQSTDVISHEKRLPVDLEEGDYFVKVMVDSGSAISELLTPDNNTVVARNGEGNPKTVSVTIGIQVDLQAETVTAPSPLVPGHEFVVNWSVSNQGVDPLISYAWEDAIYLSDNDTFESGVDRSLGLFGQTSMPAEGASYSASQSLRLPTDVTAGAKFLLLVVDVDNEVFEPTNKLDPTQTPNNTIALPVDVQLLPTDLTINVNFDAPHRLPTNGAIGEIVDLSWQVCNDGVYRTNVASWKDRAYLSADLTLDTNVDSLLSTFTPSDVLEADECYVATAAAAIPRVTPGNHHLIFVTDRDNDVYEQAPGESNNVTTAPIGITDLAADLVVEAVSASSANGPDTGRSGEPLHVTWTVCNRGTFATTVGSWTDRIFLRPTSGGGDITIGTPTRSGALGVGQCYTGVGDFEIPINVVGQASLFIHTDATSAVFELQDDNNTNVPAHPLEIGIKPWAADLTVTGTVQNHSLVAGETLNVTWTVTNSGLDRTNVSTWVDRVYLSLDDQLDVAVDHAIDSRTRGGFLDPGQDYLVPAHSVTVPISLRGQYFLLIKTDADNNVFELNENNNIFRKPMLINVEERLAADLKVESIVPTLGAPFISGQHVQLSWTVENLGEGPTNVQAWRDAVYLTRDNILDRPGDAFLGYKTHDGFVALDGAYTVRDQSFPIRLGLSGAYHLCVVPDSGNQVYEAGREDDWICSDTTVNVVAPDPADLVVESVTPPEPLDPKNPAIPLGSLQTFKWTIKNTGSVPVRGSWQDSLYLSADQFWDIDDVFVGRFPTTPPGAVLQPDQSHETTQNDVETPGVTPLAPPAGYYVIVRTDVFNNVPEVDETNNVCNPDAGCSMGSFQVAAIPLCLHFPDDGCVGDTGPLDNGQSKYYALNTPAGETVKISLNHESPSAQTELYVRFGAVPTPSQYDYISITTGAAQDITIPTTQTGTYYALVRAAAGVTFPNVSVAGEIIPFGLSGVEPRTVGAGEVTLRIAGSRLNSEVGFFLRSAENGDLFPAQRSLVLDAISARATFDLSEVVLGSYHLVALAPEPAQETELPGVIVVEPPKPLLVTAEFSGLPALRKGTSALTTLVIRNSSNVDVPAAAIHVSLANRNGLSLTIFAGDNDLDPLVELIGNSSSREILSDAFLIGFLPAASTGQLPVRLRSSPGTAGTVYASALAAHPYTYETFTSDVFFPLVYQTLYSARPYVPELSLDADFERAVSELTTHLAGQFRQFGLELTEDTAAARASSDSRTTYESMTWEILKCTAHVELDLVCHPILGLACLVILTPRTICHCVPAIHCACCMGSVEECCGVGGVRTKDGCVLWETYFEYKFTVTPNGIPHCDCEERVKIHDHCPPLKDPLDPNEKIGPPGSGDELWSTKDVGFSYNVLFENVASATAAAGVVQIKDRLDPSLDIGSFRIGQIQFGETVIDPPDDRGSFSTSVDLSATRGVQVDVTAGVNVSTREAFWLLTARDAQTGEFPSDPDKGVLPPNDETGRGQGSVVFTMKPRDDVPTGTVIRNKATIFFDFNEPIVTNEVFNTIDADVPSSKVDSLAPVSAEPLLSLSWSGDDVVPGSDPRFEGSGVRSFTIFGRVDSGAFAPVITDSFDTSVTFQARGGGTYDFYSVASDNVGNIEAAPPPDDPDATTTVAVQIPFMPEVGLATATTVPLFTLGTANLDRIEHAILDLASGRYACPDGLLYPPDNACWAPLDQWADILLRGLQPCTQYRFAGIARSDSGVETDIGMEVLVLTSVQGDVDGDGLVTESDLDIVQGQLGLCYGQAGFDARANLNADDCVTFADRGLVLSHIGRGDYSYDGFVWYDDLADFINPACLLGPGGPVSSACRQGDFDLDGDIDLEDAAALQRSFLSDADPCGP